MKNNKLSQNSQDFEMVSRVAVVTFYQAGNSMAFQSLLSCTLVSTSKKSNNPFGILSLKIRYFKTVRNFSNDLLVNSVSKFPRGLVVRIRRSHRRGPGSIPGVGSFISFKELFFNFILQVIWKFMEFNFLLNVISISNILQTVTGSAQNRYLPALVLPLGLSFSEVWLAL